MKNLPKKIYLNVGPDPGDDFSKLHEVTWSEDRIDPADVEYNLVKTPLPVGSKDELVGVARVRIIDNTSNHPFRRGEEVTITHLYEDVDQEVLDLDEVMCIGRSGGDLMWSISLNEITLE